MPSNTFLPLDDGEPGFQHSGLLVVTVSPLPGSWGMEQGTRREGVEKGAKQERKETCLHTDTLGCNYSTWVQRRLDLRQDLRAGS